MAGLTLAAVPSAVRCARMFARACLRQWGLESMAEDSELVISELVTNAVQATGITEAEPRWSQLDGLATIQVRLVLSDRSIVIGAWDRNPEPPVQAEPGTDSENGRGLAIVAALCQRWDYLAAPGRQVRLGGTGHPARRLNAVRAAAPPVSLQFRTEPVP